MNSKSEMRNYCGKCPKRNSCTKLCEEVKRYVNQDCAPMGAFIMDSTKIENFDESFFDPKEPSKDYTSRQLKRLIIELYFEGKTQQEIAYHLPCSQSYISQTIKKFKENSLKLS